MSRFVWLSLLLVLGLLGGRATAGPPPAESQRIQLLFNRNNAAATQRSRQFVAAARQQGAPLQLAEGYWLLGNALRDQGRFDSSLYYGHRALALLQGRRSELTAQAYTLLAQIYKRLADAEHTQPLTRQALRLAGQAVAAARQGPYPVALSRASIVQGIIYRDLGQYDSARACYLRGIALAQQHPSLPSPLPIGYADYGQLLMDQDHNFAGAIAALRRAVPLYQREGNRNGLEHAYRNLSWAYRQQGNTGAALRTADSSLVLGRASGDPHRLSNSLEAAYLAYRAAGRLPRALDLLEESKHLTDQLASANIARAIASRQTAYEQAQQQARLAELNRANARQRSGLWGLGAGTLLLLGLLGLAGWQYRLIRRANARLSVSNQLVRDNHRRLAEQAERLATLLREVHHRVKNNLAVVASLLRLQANRLADPDAAGAVRESQQRIEAMSLIHQGLYQTADVTAVDMHGYISDLVQSLSATYQLTAADFDQQLDIAPLRLEVDVAVPLGLLLNELLTNFFKHALGRTGAQRPALRVALSEPPGGGLLLEVQDNGPGFDPASVRPHESFGQRLVSALARQLGGQLALSTAHGTHYQLRLPTLVPLGPLAS